MQIKPPLSSLYCFAVCVIVESSKPPPPVLFLIVFIFPFPRLVLSLISIVMIGSDKPWGPSKGLRSLAGVHHYKTHTHIATDMVGMVGEDEVHAVSQELAHSEGHTHFPKVVPGGKKHAWIQGESIPIHWQTQSSSKWETNPASTHTVTQHTHCTLWSTLAFLFISTLLCLGISRETHKHTHMHTHSPTQQKHTHFQNFSFVLSCHVAEQSEVQRGEERKKSCLKQNKSRHPVEHRSLV